MNIEAPIVPGESAAGIQIGSPIEEVLKEDKHSFDSGEREKPWFPTLVKTRYRSAMVDVWAGNGRVIQIMVHSIATKPYDAEKEPTGFMIKQTCERRLVTQI